MKVLQINSVCGVGSTGRIATDIHNILIEQGHESYIAYGRDLPKNCDTAIRIGTKYDNYTHIAITRVFDKHGFGSKKATHDFLRRVEKLDPDIIHLHNIHGYYINIEILFEYLKNANKPVIWTLHDCWAFTGHCAYFDYSRCDKWKTSCEKCPQKKSYPSSICMDNSKWNYQKKLELFSSINNMTIVTPSNWLAELVKQSFLNKFPIKVINNGIDLEVFKPTPSDFRKKYDIEAQFIILGVASIWDRRKGLLDFIELSKKLDYKYKIVLVGLSNKQLNELPQNIIGITRTNNVKELAQIYSASDLFFNPTTEDNFPTTNLESLACGTPVLTYNTGGSVESIDNSCGIIINEKNDLKVYEMIQTKSWELLSNSNCLERSRLYDKKEKAIDYTNIYAEGLKNENSTH